MQIVLEIEELLSHCQFVIKLLFYLLLLPHQKLPFKATINNSLDIVKEFNWIIIEKIFSSVQ